MTILLGFFWFILNAKLIIDLKMIKKITNLFIKNLNISGLSFFTIISILISYYYNYQKKLENQKYNNLLNNII